MMGKRKDQVAVKKTIDLKDKLDAYRASAIAAGKSRGKSPSRPGHLALASAAAGGAALAITPAAEAVIQGPPPGTPLPINLTTTTSTRVSANIDMDGDGKTDFKIYQSRSSYTFTISSIPISTTTTNRAGIYAQKYFATTGPPVPAGIIASSSGRFALPISTPNYNIANNLTGPSSGNWRTSGAQLGSSYSVPFQGPGNKYVGVRFTNATGEHFGWIQVSVAADSSSVTILDWAYEDVADTPILAGATSSAPAVVPTLNEWGLIVLMTLLAGAAAWKMNRPEPFLQA